MVLFIRSSSLSSIYRHIPQLPLAALKDIPNLKSTALTKLSTEIDRHYTLLANSLTSLKEAAAALTEAIAPVLQVTLQEETESLLRGSPVFTSLPLHTIALLFKLIEKGYWAELVRKQAVVADFKSSAAEAQRRARDGGGDNSSGKKGLECSEGFLQVHITAWMLSPDVNDAAVQADISIITQDAASC